MTTGNRTVLLASASPRRQELLSRFGLAFSILPAEGVDESLACGTALEIAAGLAGRKAAWSWDRAVSLGMETRLLWVLGADTVVAIDGEVLGKPAGASDAYRMLRKLSGRTHQVITGVAVVSPDDAGRASSRIESETSEVAFKELGRREIARYINSGDPFGKAGAYGIQSGGGALIAGFKGCYYNIMGLPVRRAFRLLGLDPPVCDCGGHPLLLGSPSGPADCSRLQS